MKAEEEYLKNLKSYVGNHSSDIEIDEVEKYISKHAGRQSSFKRKSMIVLSIFLLCGGAGLLFQIMSSPKAKSSKPITDVVVPEERKREKIVMKASATPILKSKKSKPLPHKQKMVILDNSFIQEGANLIVDVSAYDNITSPLVDISDYQNIVTN